ncbi:MAG: hypothetical protein GQ474_07890 [Sulfurimonas sp.]|nr:hypothetical protein [Sulfurimonas sp.]
MSNKFQALNDYVIAKEVEVGEEKVGSIIVDLGSDLKDHTTATVVSIGQEVKYLKGGEDVLFLKQNSKEVICNGETFRAIRSENIILKL